MARALENWLESFLLYTENTEPSSLYRRWVGISTIASVLQRKCRLNWGTETFFPNMYIVLVGPPAARKGTAMRAGKLFLNKMGITIAADEGSRQKLIRTMSECAVADPIQNGQIEYHSSLTIFSSELTVFLGYDSKELLAMLCKWYDCEERYTYETIQRGREEIPNVWANLMGATTPGQLQAALPIDAISSGFSSRIVFVYAADKEKVVIKPELSEEQLELEGQLLNDLGEIRQLSGAYETTPAFERFYTEWREEAESSQVFTDSRLDYYVQRRPTHLFKLCLINAAAERDDLVLTERDLQAASEQLEEAERMMPQVFKGIGANPLAPHQIRMQRMIQLHKHIERRSIEGEFFSDLTPLQIDEVLQSLQRQRLVKLDILSGIITYIGEE